MSPHAGSHNLGIVGIDGAFGEKGRLHAGRQASAQQGPQVPGIGDAVKN